jgi:hypothetical protein
MDVDDNCSDEEALEKAITGFGLETVCTSLIQKRHKFDINATIFQIQKYVEKIADELGPTLLKFA